MNLKFNSERFALHIVNWWIRPTTSSRLITSTSSPANHWDFFYLMKKKRKRKEKMKKKNPLTSVLLRTNTSESLSMVWTFTFAMSARLKRTYAHAVFTNATYRTCAFVRVEFLLTRAVVWTRVRWAVASHFLFTTRWMLFCDWLQSSCWSQCSRQKSLRIGKEGG